MAVSKNRRKNQKTKKKPTRGKDYKMSRLIEEGKQHFNGMYYQIENGLTPIEDIVNEYSNIVWGEGVDETVIKENDVSIEVVKNDIAELRVKMKEIKYEQETLHQSYQEKKISPEDVNWKYIELTQRLIELFSGFEDKISNCLNNAVKALDCKSAPSQVNEE